ncbi:MAG: hypothetical protein MIO92_16930, partial [Methanosarcinaceae archaeon]|nr:hypothetical protein [Methanosarcinaceae archaeon]
YSDEYGPFNYPNDASGDWKVMWYDAGISIPLRVLYQFDIDEVRTLYELNLNPNLVPNPSFEIGSGQWPDKWDHTQAFNIANAGTFLWDNTVAHSGSYSIGFTNCNHSDFLTWTSDFIPYEVGQAYEIEFWYLYSTNSYYSTYLHWGYSLYDENFNLYGNDVSSTNAGVTGEWIKRNFFIHGNDPKPKYLRISFSTRGAIPPNLATIWVDDVRMVKRY